MKSTWKRIHLLAAGLIVSLSLSMPSEADNSGDHDRARQAVEAGEILPLKTVLEKIDREAPGQVMEVELERKEGRWVYKIKLLRAGGLLTKLQVDARSGSIVSRRERDTSTKH